MGSLILELDELFARNIWVGGSEAHVGAFDIVIISHPFTAGEDAVIAWAALQDDAAVSSISTLPDGRDIIFLTRLHTSQSLDEAVMEQVSHMKSRLLQRV